MGYIKLDKKNYFYNLDIIKQKTKSIDKIALVLKDNAYGHGIKEIATMAKEYGIKKAIVRDFDEANIIHDYFEQILILADIKKDTFSHKFHISINSMSDLEKLPKNSNIHIKIDTSMHRNGITPQELKHSIYRAFERGLNICGIFTHFKSADSFGREFFYQKRAFKLIKIEVLKICEILNIPIPQFHSYNSSALFRCDEFNDDFARIGLASYGYILLDKEFKKPTLKPVLSLWGNKISTRVIKKGQSVGYNGKFVADKDMQISTYDIGYSDGFRRICNNIQYKLNNLYNILGTISMDNMSINSTEDTICLFDDISILSKLHNTIEYELLVGLNQKLKRIII